MDRFKPPETGDIAEASCESCGNSRISTDMAYDERLENYFCDRRCFGDWATNNMSVLIRYYYDINIVDY